MTHRREKGAYSRTIYCNEEIIMISYCFHFRSIDPLMSECMDWFGLALEDLDVYPQAGFQVILDSQILIIDAKYQ